MTAVMPGRLRLPANFLRCRRSICSSLPLQNSAISAAPIAVTQASMRATTATTVGHSVRATFKAWASLVKLPLFEWYRKSDYTADRIGLLCCQDINVALSTMIKKAGLPRKYYDQINIDGFIQQARDFNENYTGTLNVIVKNLTIRSAEFPWLVDRAAKLLDWYEHGNYNQIVNS